jgi:hypothetical protein
MWRSLAANHPRHGGADHAIGVATMSLSEIISALSPKHHRLPSTKKPATA